MKVHAEKKLKKPATKKASAKRKTSLTAKKIITANILFESFKRSEITESEKKKIHSFLKKISDENKTCLFTREETRLWATGFVIGNKLK